MIPEPSPLLVLCFLVVSAGACAFLLAGIWRFSKERSLFYSRVLPCAGAWLLFTAALGQSGVLLDFSMPPKVVILISIGLVLTVAISFSRPVRAFTDNLPVWFIIAINVFRLPLELTMHLAASEGIMPPQMSYSGLNLDILTGFLAIPVAWLAFTKRLPRIGMRLFNIVGATLLLTVVTIAVFSMPTPLRRFPNDPPNVWISYFPFVWLPTVLVPIALFSHLSLFRRAAQSFKSRG